MSRKSGKCQEKKCVPHTYICNLYIHIHDTYMPHVFYHALRNT